jgi:hypothetical protein
MLYVGKPTPIVRALPQQAVSHFANGGCRHNNEADVLLSRRDRVLVANIRARERALGYR